MARHKIAKINDNNSSITSNNNNMTTMATTTTTTTATSNGNILNNINNNSINQNNNRIRHHHENKLNKNSKETKIKDKSENFSMKNNDNNNDNIMIDRLCLNNNNNSHHNNENNSSNNNKHHSHHHSHRHNNNNNLNNCSMEHQKQNLLATKPATPSEETTTTKISTNLSHENNIDNSNSNLTTNTSTTLTSTTTTWKTNISNMILSCTNILSRAKYYLSSLRPGTFFTSLIPVLMGTVLACKTSGGHFSWIILLATLITVISVHAAGNLVNTYCDFVRGIDSKRQSDDRTLVDSILTPEEVVNLGVLFYFIGCIGFLIVVILSPARMELLAFIYFGGISSSFLYTGGIGLKYIALGDLIIMITFGPVSVLYSFIAQTGTIRLVTLLYAIPLALNAEAILHSNNTRDIEVDRKAGCVTIAILIGYRASHVLFSLLLFIPYILFVVVSINYSLWLLLPLITLPKAFMLEKRFRQRQLSSIPRQMAILNFYFGMFYLFACFMSPAHKLPGLWPV